MIENPSKGREVPIRVFQPGGYLPTKRGYGGVCEHPVGSSWKAVGSYREQNRNWYQDVEHDVMEDEKTHRDSNGRWLPGKSANPAGRG
jgi:hypothetical protein